MDSSSHPDLLITRLDNHSKLLLPEKPINPMILTFDQALISTPPDPNPKPEGELWPKLTELDDLPMRSAPAYLVPEQKSGLNDRPPSPSNERSPTKQVITEPAYQLNPQSASVCKSERVRDSPLQTEVANRPSNPPFTKSQMEVIRDSADQSANEVESDVRKALSADDEGVGGKKTEPIRQGAYYDMLLQTKESYRSSARGRLARVVEESESFTRREFGGNVLNYMSTHSSANHAANLANYADFSYKHPSNHHNNHINFSYTHSSYHSGNFISSKSAPAGSAVRTGSTFGLLRRGASEGGNLGRGRHAVYGRTQSRRPKSLAYTLLWPLVKIRNGYVGCMMGLEGAGDLSGMAQAGTYATKARYFADMPLSKTDSRNYG